MKKLMIAAAMVCAAAFTQAASVTWSAADIMDGQNKANGWLAYAFVSSMNAHSVIDDTYTKLATAPSDALALIKSGDATTLHNSHQINWDPIMVSNGSVSFTEDMSWNGVGKDDSLTPYLIIINSDSLDTATGYIMTDPQTVTFAKDDSAVTVPFGSMANTSFTPLSADIPEPTSAMLMLLGAAGLALRRKRA